MECFAGRWQQVADTCEVPGNEPCPATLDLAQAEPCLARTCGYAGVLCSCSSPTCSGIFQEPSTMCTAPTPAACQTTPVDDGPCQPEAQVCGITCCGRSWTCTDGHWVGQENPCPP